MSLKVRFNFGTKCEEEINGSTVGGVDDVEIISDDDSLGGSIPQLLEGTVVVHPEPVIKKKLVFREPEFKQASTSKKIGKGGSTVSGADMSLTDDENTHLLMQRVPDHWRNLLTLLLNKSVRCDHLTTLLAMRYRQQLTHSTESWDRLLSALSRKTPFVGADARTRTSRQPSFKEKQKPKRKKGRPPVSYMENITNISGLSVQETVHKSQDRAAWREMVVSRCAATNTEPGDADSQGLLWCFPDLFIKNFLIFLIQFHDAVSADSLDRFFSTAHMETQPPSVRCLLQELSSILSKRSGLCRDDHATKNIEKKGMCFYESVQTSTADSNLRGDRNKSKIINSSGQSEELDDGAGSKMTALPQSFRNLAPGFSQVTNNSGTENTKKVAAEKTKQLVTDEVKNDDSFVIILDSSDDEECDADRMGAADTVNTGVMCKGGDEEGLECEKPLEAGNNAARVAETSLQAESESLGAVEDIDRNNSEAGSVLMTQVQKLKEVLTSGEGDSTSMDLDFLLSLLPSQINKVFASVNWDNIEEDGMCGLIRGVVALSDSLGHTASIALVDSILTPIYCEVEETPSRQMASCLSDLAASFPQPLAGVLCDRLTGSPCSSVQSEVVASLCKSWSSDTLAFFLRQLCRSEVQLDENLLNVVQSVTGEHPDLSSDLLDLVLCLLETGAVPLAKNAKYGRLVLNFVKFYKNQMNSSQSPSLQIIVNAHTSVIRKSLRSVVSSLPT